MQDNGSARAFSLSLTYREFILTGRLPVCCSGLTALRVSTSTLSTIKEDKAHAKLPD